MHPFPDNVYISWGNLIGARFRVESVSLLPVTDHYDPCRLALDEYVCYSSFLSSKVHNAITIKQIKV